MKHLFITITLLLIFTTQALAHPHTFIEVKPTIKINNETINKIHVHWKLDEMTSMMLIEELDTNGNGKFEKSESDFIYENYFSSLDEYNFYTHIYSNKKRLMITPKNFKASIEDNKLIYAFDIEQQLNTQNLKIGFFDVTLFVGMIIKKEYITLNGINETRQTQLKKNIFEVK